ncbi:uncharacterized protein LOC134756201 [Cydia strobilella]|uniref:uncharacterized protein LOC134756201 n=1 Tax=Cydia strobilella TaxID=1100964 RepID=UPI00300684B9
MSDDVVVLLSPVCLCWQYFTSFSDWKLSATPAEEYLHSEYFFGNCFKSQGAVFYTHTSFNHLQLLGKLILRAWIPVPRIPTCIILRATSSLDDLFRYTSYNFQVCVPRITYCHSHTRYKYHFLEWYIPKNFTGGMDWDVYFFGPRSMQW